MVSDDEVQLSIFLSQDPHGAAMLEMSRATVYSLGGSLHSLVRAQGSLGSSVSTTSGFGVKHSHQFPQLLSV